MERVTLPNGLSVWAPSAFEASIVYREIFVERPYEQHGVTIPDDAVVFDVGANIGLFTLRVLERAPRAHVHAFEPVPAVFGALQRNLAAHASHAHAWNVGLAGAAGEATFEVDRFATLASTMHPEVLDHRAIPTASLVAWTDAGLADLERVTPGRFWVRAARAGLRRPGSALITALTVAPLAAALRVRRTLCLQRPRCRLTTLSEALAQAGVGVVDLVKIDVEGAEEQVLNGIAADDWPRLRQLVIEVHDIGGRLERLTEMLRSRGYRTAHDREDWALHELLGISTLYALRA